MRKAFLVTALVLVAAACGDSADTTTTLPPATTTQATTTTAAPTTTAPPTTTTAPPTTTTTLPPTTTTVAPTTTTPPVPVAQLSGNGLGAADFGDDAETALAAVTQVLGPPSFDDGWVNALDSGCRGTQVRFPQWDGVFMILTDAATDYAGEGAPHFAFWGAFPGTVTIATPSGFVPGVTPYQDLVDAYGPLQPEFNDLFELWLVDIGTGAEAGIEFEIENPENPSEPMVGMSAGARDICGE